MALFKCKMCGGTIEFEPCEMSRRCYEACGADKTLLTVPGAGHGLGFLIDNAGYTAALAEFYEKVL